MQGKKLYRSRTNRVIAGVCGGLGEYFGIDPIIFRVLFLFVHGINLIYFIFWIVVPENPNQPKSKGTSILVKILLIFFMIFIGFFFFNLAKNFFGF